MPFFISIITALRPKPATNYSKIIFILFVVALVVFVVGMVIATT
jgi:hypothetical protein